MGQGAQPVISHQSLAGLHVRKQTPEQEEAGLPHLQTLSRLLCSVTNGGVRCVRFSVAKNSRAFPISESGQSAKDDSVCERQTPQVKRNPTSEEGGQGIHGNSDKCFFILQRN